jgi:HEAT repeat protein
MRALALGALLAATTAQADTAARADTAALASDLGGADEARAEEAARKLGQSAEPKAVETLLEALKNGPPPKVAMAALKALGGKKDPRAVAALAEWTHHRAPDVRKAALMGLAQAPAGDKRAAAAMTAALGDSDAEVRAQAAKGLGDRRERSAEARLIKLMEHRDASAATALAAIATPELAHRLSEMLGQVPDPILCTTLGEMLKRGDFGPEPIRVEVVRTLSKVPGVDSTAVLLEYVAATERDKNRPSRLEAQKIVDERSRQ